MKVEQKNIEVLQDETGTLTYLTLVDASLLLKNYMPNVKRATQES